ncbi:eIF4-gamma/eIF5/eIF2-epsilon-domain-containing protein [Powellomyces hirtus]|nr:eIF4-gamma/eIF5/eIF2-epsilon-domain-containing protein [Powellomyces hirtus]
MGLNVKDIQIEEGFRAEIKYLSGDKPKRCVFFLARLITKNARIEPGGLGGLNINWWSSKQWCNASVCDYLHKAQEKAIYRNMQDIMSQATTFIEQLQARHATIAAENYPIVGMQKLHITRRQGSAGRDSDRSGRSGGSDEESRGMNGGGRRTGPEGRGLPLGASWRDPHTKGSDLYREDDVSRSQRSSAAPSASPLYKTRLCERFEIEGNCPYGSRCTFAHGTAELRERVPTTNDAGEHKDPHSSSFFKTRLCERFVNEGFCQYGRHCHYAHGPSELRERPAPTRENGRDEGHGEPRPIRNGTPPLRKKIESPLHPVTSRREAPTLGPSQPDALAVPTLSSRPRTPMTAPNTPPIAGSHRKDNYSSLKELLANDDKEKPWMHVVHLPENDPAFANMHHPTPRPYSTPSSMAAPHIERTPTFILEEKLTDALSHTLLSGHLPLNDEIKELTRLEFKHDLTKRQVFSILFGALIADGTYESSRIRSRVELFKQVVRSRTDQMALIKAVEKKFSRSGDTVQAKFLVIVKDLYDTDLVEEDVVLNWFDGMHEYPDFKTKIEPFVTWLRTAEEEDD